VQHVGADSFAPDIAAADRGFASAKNEDAALARGVLKRRHGLRRCRYHGADGTARWVGLGVIADNLVNTATFLNARATA
jgi:hypothetical protein